jgi:hypothetical protein
MSSEPKTRTRLVNLMGLFPAHRTNQRSQYAVELSATLISLIAHRSQLIAHAASYTSRYYQALIKNYVRLVNCPIYSVVKYRPHELAFI